MVRAVQDSYRANAGGRYSCAVDPVDSFASNTGAATDLAAPSVARWVDSYIGGGACKLSVPCNARGATDRNGLGASLWLRRVRQYTIASGGFWCGLLASVPSVADKSLSAHAWSYNGWLHVDHSCNASSVSYIRCNRKSSRAPRMCRVNP